MLQLLWFIRLQAALQRERSKLLGKLFCFPPNRQIIHTYPQQYHSQEHPAFQQDLSITESRQSPSPSSLPPVYFQKKHEAGKSLSYASFPHCQWILAEKSSKETSAGDLANFWRPVDVIAYQQCTCQPGGNAEKKYMFSKFM